MLRVTGEKLRQQMISVQTGFALKSSKSLKKIRRKLERSASDKSPAWIEGGKVWIERD